MSDGGALRKKLIDTAARWIGRSEYDGSFREIIDVYNGITPLPRGYRMTYEDPWCAAFVSAAGAAAGLSAAVLPECSCDAMIERYKAAGRWIEDDGYVPQLGDIIIFDWQDADAAGDNRGSGDHAAIVESVRDRSITVIEGNSSDAVGRRTLSVNGRYIRGYCLPDYESAERRMAVYSDDLEAVLSSGEAVSVMGYEEAGAVSAAGGGVSGAYPTLRYGDISVHTAMLQGALEYLGYKPRWYIGQWCDGEYGSGTRSAVTEYQRDLGLAADGVCGEKTWSAVLRG